MIFSPNQNTTGAFMQKSCVSPKGNAYSKPEREREQMKQNFINDL